MSTLPNPSAGGVPTIRNTVAEIKQYLTSHGIPFSASDKKASLLARIPGGALPPKVPGSAPKVPGSAPKVPGSAPKVPGSATSKGGTPGNVPRGSNVTKSPFVATVAKSPSSAGSPEEKSYTYRVLDIHTMCTSAVKEHASQICATMMSKFEQAGMPEGVRQLMAERMLDAMLSALVPSSQEATDAVTWAANGGRL